MSQNRDFPKAIAAGLSFTNSVRLLGSGIATVFSEGGDATCADTMDPAKIVVVTKAAIAMLLFMRFDSLDANWVILAKIPATKDVKSCIFLNIIEDNSSCDIIPLG